MKTQVALGSAEVTSATAAQRLLLLPHKSHQADVNFKSVLAQLGKIHTIEALALQKQ